LIFCVYQYRHKLAYTNPNMMMHYVQANIMFLWLFRTLSRVQMERIRGTGGYGMVYAYGKDTVVKVCDTASEVLLVKKCMCALVHSNIVRIIDIDISHRRMIMKDGGYNLSDVLTGNANFCITRNQVNAIADGICRGIRHLHKNNYAHCDIKLLNILLHTDTPTIPTVCDFGTLHQLNGHTLCSPTSLPRVFHYASPSILNNEPHLTTFNTDWFACAVVLYTLYVHTCRSPNTPLTNASRPFHIHAYCEPVSENRQVRSERKIYDTLVSCDCPSPRAQWIEQALHEKMEGTDYQW